MMDRHRFAKRARELTEHAQVIEDLARMPDRATEKDFRQTADLMKRAASDLEELVKATPTGCVCRRIQDDGYDYLIYAESCLHHGSLYLREKALKEGYAKMEKKLKDEVRMRLITAVLSGTAEMLGEDEDALAKRAIAIADATIDRISREA